MTEALPAPAVNRWTVLVAVMAGTFISILDTTIINVGLPHIMTSFGSNVEEAKWISTGFMIAAACSMPLTGWAGRRFGYGTVYLFSLSLFAVGAASSASAPTLNYLIGSRFLQGLAAGMVQPTSIAILTRTFPPHIRGRVFGVWAIGVMTAPTLGPTVGGVLIEYFNWRAIFTMSLIVSLIAALINSAVLSRERDEAPIPFDWKGYVTLVVFLVVGLLTISNGQEVGWGSKTILLGAVVTVASLLAFISVEWDEEHPLVPLRLFRIPDFSLAIFLTIYRSTGLFGAVFLLPIFLMQVQGRGPLEVGLLVMPGSIAMAMCSPLAGWITDRFGGRWPTVVGMLCIAYSLYVYRYIDPLTSNWQLVYPQLFRGIGISMVMTPVVTTGMNAVGREDAGHASWMLNLCQRGGGAFAISILSTLLHRQTVIHRERLGSTIMAVGTAPRGYIYRGVALGIAPQDARGAVRAAFGQEVGRAATAIAFQNIFYMAGLATATAVIPALLMNRFGPQMRRGDG